MRKAKWLVTLAAVVVAVVMVGGHIGHGSISGDAVLTQLIAYTNESSPGPTKDYYWQNGTAQIDTSVFPAAGQVTFTVDSQGRSSVARATLTYQMFASSQGQRQGDPLNPPTGWPTTNPKTTIGPYALTGKTYSGYLWNRSHSIGDSLAGAQSYTSADNFTTGTRPQNVGADQNGGMRAPEEAAENYWTSHPGTQATIWYQTTPVYNGGETIPRGSIVDEKSSDGSLDVEFVVINSAEGWTIDYTSATATHL